MSDLISRQDAIKAIEDLQDCYNGFSDTYDKACIIGVLEEVPRMDAVEVVRCKDCTNWEYDVIFSDGWCRGKRRGNPEWFCADGERRKHE